MIILHKYLENYKKFLEKNELKIYILSRDFHYFYLYLLKFLKFIYFFSHFKEFKKIYKKKKVYSILKKIIQKLRVYG
jgi:hypothetical protein